MRRGSRRTGHRRQQRRHHPGPDAVQHDRRGLGRRHRGASAGPFSGHPQRGDLLAEQSQRCRRIGVRADHQHLVGGRPVRLGGAVQLRSRQSRHHRAHPYRCQGPGPVRGSRQRHLPAGPHGDDRRRIRGGARAVRRADRPALARACRQSGAVPGLAGGRRHQRPGVHRLRPQGHPGGSADRRASLRCRRRCVGSR